MINTEISYSNNFNHYFEGTDLLNYSFKDSIEDSVRFLTEKLDKIFCF